MFGAYTSNVTNHAKVHFRSGRWRSSSINHFRPATTRLRSASPRRNGDVLGARSVLITSVLRLSAHYLMMDCPARFVFAVLYKDGGQLEWASSAHFLRGHGNAALGREVCVCAYH